jgi:cellobiose phosphorylase
VGRGGWSWYTGSSGWMYRLIIESLLGLTRGARQLTLAPRMPAGWNSFTLTYRYETSSYVIRVLHDDGAGAGASAVPVLTVDGEPQHEQVIALVDTGMTHQVELRLPARLAIPEEERL